MRAIETVKPTGSTDSVLRAIEAEAFLGEMGAGSFLLVAVVLSFAVIALKLLGSKSRSPRQLAGDDLLRFQEKVAAKSLREQLASEQVTPSFDRIGKAKKELEISLDAIFSISEKLIDAGHPAERESCSRLLQFHCGKIRERTRRSFFGECRELR